jgi:hypothetical protein
MPTKASKHVLLAMLSLAVSGCALNYVIDEHAFRLSAEGAKAANEDLFRNIVRASYNHPLRFSSVTILRGGNNGDASIGLTIPLSTSAQGAFTVSPRIGISQGPTFEVVPQLSKEFAEGILQPQSLRTLSLFTEPQYNIEAVYTLFIDRIEIISPDKPKIKLPNDETLNLKDGDLPTVYNSLKDRNQFSDFQKVLRALINTSGLRTELIKVRPPATPFVEISEAKPPFDLIGMADKKVFPERCTTKEGKELVRLLRSDLITIPRFCLLRGQPGCGQSLFNNREILLSNIDTTKKCSDLVPSDNADLVQSDASSASKAVGENIYVFHIRSVYEMIHYIGSIISSIRETKDKQKPIIPCVGKYNNNLTAQEFDKTRKGDSDIDVCKAETEAKPSLNPEIFFDVKIGSDPRSFVSVEYNGKTHSILSGSAQSGNATQVMEILTQLLNLSRSPEDIQRTPTVVLSP